MAELHYSGGEINDCWPMPKMADIGTTVRFKAPGYTRKGEIYWIAGDFIHIRIDHGSYFENFSVSRFDLIDFKRPPSIPTEETTTMNYSTAILLINTNCRAILGTYEADVEGQPPVKRELFKTFDDTIAVDDIVMVPTNTRHKVTAIKVVEIDVEWDVNVQGEVKWIIGKVDQPAFKALQAQEGEAIHAIKESEKTHARNTLKAKMFAHMNPDQVKALQIAGPAPDLAGIGAAPTDEPTST